MISKKNKILFIGVITFLFVIFASLFYLGGDVTGNVIANIGGNVDSLTQKTGDKIDSIKDLFVQKKEALEQTVDGVSNKIENVKNEVADVTDAISKPIDEYARDANPTNPSQKRTYDKKIYRGDDIFIPYTDPILQDEVEKLRKENEELKEKCAID